MGLPRATPLKHNETFNTELLRNDVPVISGPLTQFSTKCGYKASTEVSVGVIKQATNRGTEKLLNVASWIARAMRDTSFWQS